MYKSVLYFVVCTTYIYNNIDMYFTHVIERNVQMTSRAKRCLLLRYNNKMITQTLSSASLWSRCPIVNQITRCYLRQHRIKLFWTTTCFFFHVRSCCCMARTTGGGALMNGLFAQGDIISTSLQRNYFSVQMTNDDTYKAKVLHKIHFYV